MLRWVLASSMLAVCAEAGADEKDYHDQDLSNKSFKQASLNNADFSGATLFQCDFTQASLKKAKFVGAVRVLATWYEADLTEADFSEITNPGQTIRFSKNKLDKAKLAGINKNTLGLTFYGCSLKGADLRKSKIAAIDHECNLGKADLRGANMIKAFDINNPPAMAGALYDEDTAFPDGFDPKKWRLVLKEGDDAKKDEKK